MNRRQWAILADLGLKFWGEPVESESDTGATVPDEAGYEEDGRVVIEVDGIGEDGLATEDLPPVLRYLRESAGLESFLRGRDVQRSETKTTRARRECSA
jgi:hypothetical protein